MPRPAAPVPRTTRTAWATTCAGCASACPGIFFFDDLHPEVESAVRAAVETIADLGAVVEEIGLPSAAEAVQAWTTMAHAEAYAVHEAHLRERSGELSPDVESRLLLGKDILARDYLAARRDRERMVGEMAALLETVDVIVTPTSPVPAVAVETGRIEFAGRDVEGAKVLGRLTRLAAFTGQPAVSVPCGFTGAGLPVGLQLMGRWFAEAELLAVADAYERATPWHDRRPEDPL